MSASSNPHFKSNVDYNAVSRDIAAILPNKSWDDGSLGPVFVRLAWHASGTYDHKADHGGSAGGSMRFAPESTDGANAGLEKARAFLDPIKAKYPQLSYGDLWTLAGVVAVQEMGGPKIDWKPGRVDLDASKVESDAQVKARIPPNGRLPDASLGSTHIREVFEERMGFSDKDIVALIGAHTLGRCHTDRSGYDGPWTFNPTRFSNQFFIQLLRNEWTEKKWSGPKQFEDKSKKLMMTPADLALLSDTKFRPFVELYAKDKETFFKDFAVAFAKLLDLGVKRNGMAAGCPFAGKAKL